MENINFCMVFCGWTKEIPAIALRNQYMFTEIQRTDMADVDITMLKFRLRFSNN